MRSSSSTVGARPLATPSTSAALPSSTFSPRSLIRRWFALPGGGSRWRTRPTSAVSSRRCQNTWRTYLSGDCGLGERRRYHHGSLCSGVGWVSCSSSRVQPSYSSAEPNHMWPIHHILFPSSDLVTTLDVRYTSGVHSVTNLAFLYGVLPAHDTVQNIRDSHRGLRPEDPIQCKEHQPCNTRECVHVVGNERKPPDLAWARTMQTSSVC